MYLFYQCGHVGSVRAVGIFAFGVRPLKHTDWWRHRNPLLTTNASADQTANLLTVVISSHTILDNKVYAQGPRMRRTHHID